MAHIAKVVQMQKEKSSKVPRCKISEKTLNNYCQAFRKNSCFFYSDRRREGYIFSDLNTRTDFAHYKEAGLQKKEFLVLLNLCI